MGVTRKSYAMVYLNINTPTEQMDEIEKRLMQHNIDVDAINSRESYLDWLRDKESINPTIFITNGISHEAEFNTLNQKLEGSVLIIIGKIPGVKTAKIGRAEEQENMLKQCDDFKGLQKYFGVCFALPTFKEKVFALSNVINPIDTVKSEPPKQQSSAIGKNTKISASAPPNAHQEKHAVPSQPVPPIPPPPQGRGLEQKPKKQGPKQEQAEVVPVSIEKVPHETRTEIHEVIPGKSSEPTPIFEIDDDEKLIERLKGITEIANETKKNNEPVTVRPFATVPTTNETAIMYEENPYHQRSRHLQKQVFAQQKWENNRTIGIWSPLHRMGVTSFTINLALFLAENRVYTAVLEGLTEQHSLKNWLQRYSTIPTNWSSYAKAIHSDGKNNEIKWKYKDVIFLPLDTEDPKFEWNAQSLESYMTTTKDIDVTLVDFPTGKMTSYTEASLDYVDELWILIDDAAQETLAWKNYIQTMKQNKQVDVYLIFNKAYDFSLVKRLSTEYELPLLTQLPALHEETMRNYYETVPLYSKKEVQEKLQEPFTVLTKHILGADFAVNEKIPYSQTKKWSAKLLKILKHT